MSEEREIILRIINDAAQAYKDIIPEDRWKDPYMSINELNDEIKANIKFFGWKEDETIVGVMGIQSIKDTTLIRHSYVHPIYQRSGIGGKLLTYLMKEAETPEILVGTWATANWAIQFYEKYGFKLVTTQEKDKLLGIYWNIPERQIETSIVLKFSKNQNHLPQRILSSDLANIVEL